MPEPTGLIFARLLDGGGARPLDAAGVARWRAADGPLWVHLDRNAPGVRAWLERDAGIDPEVVDALLEEQTRPRIMPHGGGLMVNLRGVNLNPGADPEDMVSARMWIDAERVITLRGPRLLAGDDVAAELDAGRGPTTPGGLLAALAETLVTRMRPVLGGIEDELDAREEALSDDSVPDPSAAGISAERRRIIALRRYLAPQRDAMVELCAVEADWLGAAPRRSLRETTNHVTRYVEDLDAARERGSVMHEEVTERLSIRMNRIMYVLSLVATIFLPLSFLTGLLGINVGGIPGTDVAWAFLAVCVALALLLALELLLFRRWHWLE